MSKCLVTGAAGFLGYYVVQQLLAQNHEVIAVDNYIRGEKDQHYLALIAHPKVSAIEFDLTKDLSSSGLPKDVDYIFHLAALNGTQNFYERPFEVLRCCTLPTFQLLEYYKKSAIKRFLFAGTSEAYASTVTRFNWPVPTAEDVPLSIDDPTNPRWSYGASKLHGEVLTVQACREFGLDYSIIRYHNAYGPRMGDKHVIPDFLTRIKKGVFELYGSEDTRSFIYAEDAAKATIQVAMTPACANQTVNIGSEEEIKIIQLAKTILKLTGHQQEIICHPSPKGSVSRRAPTIKKLVSLTGYAPQWTLEQGLQETIKFYLK
jgi:nucleoside-diphosphate-sugar epimerase